MRADDSNGATEQLQRIGEEQVVLGGNLGARHRVLENRALQVAQTPRGFGFVALAVRRGRGHLGDANSAAATCGASGHRLAAA